MAAVGNICGVVDAISNFELRSMELLNGRFQALRRLAALLEQAGDATGFIPDISKLIPLAQIDTTLYEQIRVQCPFLNLPPASDSAEQALGKLRAQVNAAYGSLLAQLNAHPFNLMGLLQQKLNDYQNKVNFDVLAGQDFLSCLQAVCQGAAALSNTVQNSGRSLENVVKTSQTYFKNFVEGDGTVLTAPAQAKYDDFLKVKTSIQKDLINVDTSNFATVKTSPTTSNVDVSVFNLPTT